MLELLQRGQNSDTFPIINRVQRHGVVSLQRLAVFLVSSAGCARVAAAAMASSATRDMLMPADLASSTMAWSMDSSR